MFSWTELPQSQIIAVGESCLLVTSSTKRNKIDQTVKWNEIETVRSIQRVKMLERGSWELVAAVYVQQDWSSAQVAHKRARQNLPVSQRTSFMSLMQLSPHAGFCFSFFG